MRLLTRQRKCLASFPTPCLAQQISTSPIGPTDVKWPSTSALSPQPKKQFSIALLTLLLPQSKCESRPRFALTPTICRAQGIVFQPLVVETFGEWDIDAVKYLKDIARLDACRRGKSDAIEIKHFFQRLSLGHLKHGQRKTWLFWAYLCLFWGSERGPHGHRWVIYSTQTPTR